MAIFGVDVICMVASPTPKVGRVQNLKNVHSVPFSQILYIHHNNDKVVRFTVHFIVFISDNYYSEYETSRGMLSSQSGLGHDNYETAEKHVQCCSMQNEYNINYIVQGMRGG